MCLLVLARMSVCVKVHECLDVFVRVCELSCLYVCMCVCFCACVCASVNLYMLVHACVCKCACGMFSVYRFKFNLCKVENKCIPRIIKLFSAVKIFFTFFE